MSKSRPVEPIVPIFNKEDLPSNWNLIPIGEICVPVDKVNPRARPDTEFDYIDISGIDNNCFRIAETKKYIGRQAPSRARQLVRAGDIVFSTVRTYLKNIARVAPEYDWQIASTGFCVLRPKEPEFNKYLYYYVQYEPFLNQLAKFQRGTSYPAVRDGDVFAQLIPVPSKEEASRIVAEIEKQFSRLDEAVANLKRVKANLKRYKAAVLKAAVEGKLTEDWRKAHPDVEPASELLKRILADRRAKWEQAEIDKMKAAGKEPKDIKWTKRYKEPDPIRAEDIYDIPKSWAWANLGQVSWSVKDGPHYSPKYAATGVPFITGGNIRPDGIDFSSAKYISAQLHAELSERCKPEFGDLLYTKGGTTGIARINTDQREFNVWVHVAVLKLVDSIERFYLQHSLNSPHCYRQSQRYTHGVGNQDLGLTRMIWITVPLPPFQEQKQVVQEIESRMSVVKAIEKQADANLSRAERLRQSILSMAFCGRLVLANGALSVPSIGESQRHAN